MAYSSLNRYVRFVVALSLISSPLAYAKGPQPERPASSGGFAWGRNGLPSIPNNPQAGQTFEGFTPQGSRVWFTGDVAHNGQSDMPEVERFNKGINRFERGPLLPDGNVAWAAHEDAKVPSHRPTTPPTEKLSPLPTNRSLVPYGYDHGDGPKHWERMAEWNTQSEENLRRAKNEFKSNPSKAMVTTDGVNLDWKTVPGSGIAGDGSMHDYNRIIGHFSTQAMSWGIAMGFLAVVTLASPKWVNNPTVMQDYVDSLKGPVGWLGFIGFSIGYGLVYAKMVSNAPYAGVMKQLPGFMAALLAGTAVQFGVTAIANDPNVKACIGITAYELTHHFVPDMDACQRTYQMDNIKDFSGRTLKEFVPALIATTIAGVSYFALYPTAARFFMKSRVGSALVDAGTKAGVRGGALRFGLPVAITTALIWATQSQQQWIARQINEWWQTSGRWQAGTYAENNGVAEDDLYSTWEAMKKVGFADPAPVAQAKKVCYDPKRVSGPQYDCSKSAQDFDGVLKAYGEQQNSWRAKMLEPTYASMGKWYQKTMAYKANLNTAHDWYKIAIDKIIWTKRHPEAPATDERVFNMENMRKAGGGVWAFRASEDGTWRNLNTPEWNDFFMTSLACGPETEGSTERGIFGTMSKYVAKYVTGYYSPDSVIEDMKGWKTKFHPPRITEALMNSHETVCDNRSYGFGSDKFWKWMPTNNWTPADLIMDTSIKAPVNQFLVRSEGVNYNGLPAYILANVRPSVISVDGDDFFERWWAQTVGRLDVAFDARIDHDYMKMMFKTYTPIMNSSDYYWCEPHAKTRKSGVEKYLNDLADPNGLSCGAQRTHRLARGVVNGLLDEARLYIAMTMDLYATSGEAFRSEQDLNNMRLEDKTRVVQFENVIRSPAIEMMRAFEKIAATGSHMISAKDMDAATTELSTALDKYGMIIYPGKDKFGEPKTDRIKRQREVMAKLDEALVNVAENLNTYLKLGTNGRVQTPPVWIEVK